MAPEGFPIIFKNVAWDPFIHHGDLGHPRSPLVSLHGIISSRFDVLWDPLIFQGPLVPPGWSSWHHLVWGWCARARIAIMNLDFSTFRNFDFSPDAGKQATLQLAMGEFEHFP